MFFSCLISSVCSSFIWGVVVTKGSCSAPVCFSSVGFLFDIKQNRLFAYQWWRLSIDCFVFTQHQRKPHRLSRKNEVFQKSTFLAPIFREFVILIFWTFSFSYATTGIVGNLICWVACPVTEGQLTFFYFFYTLNTINWLCFFVFGFLQ